MAVWTIYNQFAVEDKSNLQYEKWHLMDFRAIIASETIPFENLSLDYI